MTTATEARAAPTTDRATGDADHEVELTTDQLLELGDHGEVLLITDSGARVLVTVVGAEHPYRVS